MSYSITIEWDRDASYRYLDALRDLFGSFRSATPAHISLVSFLKVPDEELPSLKRFLHKVSRRHYAHNLVFGRMKRDELFAEQCVAVPIQPSVELEDIWNELDT